MPAADHFYFALPDGNYVKAASNFSLMEVDAWARKNFPSSYPPGTKTGSLPYKLPDGIVIEVPAWMNESTVDRQVRASHPEYFVETIALSKATIEATTVAPREIDRSAAVIDSGEQIAFRAVLAIVAIALLAGRPYLRTLKSPTETGRWFAAHGAGLGILVGPQSRTPLGLEANIAGTLVIAAAIAVFGFIFGYAVRRILPRT